MVRNNIKRIDLEISLENSAVFILDNNIFRVVIPFTDGSSLSILLTVINNKVKPFDSVSNFIYSSLSLFIQDEIEKEVNNFLEKTHN